MTGLQIAEIRDVWPENGNEIICRYNLLCDDVYLYLSLYYVVPVVRRVSRKT